MLAAGITTFAVPYLAGVGGALYDPKSSLDIYSFAAPKRVVVRNVAVF